jgi:hypothetical protein
LHQLCIFFSVLLPIWLSLAVARVVALNFCA